VKRDKRKPTRMFHGNISLSDTNLFLVTAYWRRQWGSPTKTEEPKSSSFCFPTHLFFLRRRQCQGSNPGTIISTSWSLVMAERTYLPTIKRRKEKKGGVWRRGEDWRGGKCPFFGWCQLFFLFEGWKMAPVPFITFFSLMFLIRLFSFFAFPEAQSCTQSGRRTCSILCRMHLVRVGRNGKIVLFHFLPICQ
jgi:hypothetical protein